MTTTAEAPSPPNPRPVARPSGARHGAALYLDFLLCALLAWDLCAVVGRTALFIPVFVTLFLGMRLWFRDRLRPTPGKFCMGIRYLTSSSSQVVAEIEVLNPKLMLNAALLTAGTVELSLAYLCLAAWTVTDRAVLFCLPLEGFSSFGYWLLSGAAYLTCASYILCGSWKARVVVPVVHVLGALQYGVDLPAWAKLLGPQGLPAQAPPLLKAYFLVYCGWSCMIIVILVLSRSHLVHRYPA